MVELLIIADDFTGALDTGIQFVKRGIKTTVLVGDVLPTERLSSDSKVLVVDSETRPLSSEKAYEIVKKISEQAQKAGIPVIYKKTDSALRGHIGSELDAVICNGDNETIYYIPAYPDVNRVTKNGIHYINGVLLENSTFGKDPFDPMTDSNVLNIIKKETAQNVILVKNEDKISEIKDAGIVVCDAVTNEDIKKRGEEIRNQGCIKYLAGCAGFASFLPELLDMNGEFQGEIFKNDIFYVACGSLNAITEAQVMHAEKNGFYRKNLVEEQRFSPQYYETDQGKKFLQELEENCKKYKTVVADTFNISDADNIQNTSVKPEDIRFLISQCHGKIVRYLLEKEMDMTILMTGGDTLMGFMKEIGVNELQPVAEMDQGTVLSRLYWNNRVIQIISKSGGFGCETVLTDIAEKIIRE